jgi:hypothetical protein
MSRAELIAFIEATLESGELQFDLKADDSDILS